MSDLERRWLYMAAEDLRTAELTWREGIYAQTCFHAQQCAEKALKALVVHQTGRASPRTHSLVELLQRLPAQLRRQAPADLAATLDTYYTAARYPDALVGPLPEALPGAEEAREALDLAREALAWVERPIGGA
jgi:HEPN domain-containing protein